MYSSIIFGFSPNPSDRVGRSNTTRILIGNGKMHTSGFTDDIDDFPAALGAVVSAMFEKNQIAPDET
jgi:hypothetical protein